MISANLDDLATSLRDEQLTEREKFEYLILLVVLGALNGSVVIFSAWRSAAHPLIIVSTVGLFLIGLSLCFKVNQQGDGRAFLERVIVLGSAISLRLVVLTYAAWHGTIALKVGPGATMAEWTHAQTMGLLATIQLAACGVGFTWLYTTMEIASCGPQRTSAVIKLVRPHAVGRDASLPNKE